MPGFRTSVVYACTSRGEIHPLNVDAAGNLVPISAPLSLVPISRDHETTASSVVGLVVHPDKRFAFAANLEDRLSMVFETTVRGYRIGKDGGLLPLTSDALVVKDIVADILMDPKGRYLYLNGSDALWIYGIRPNGQLTLVHRAEPLGTFGISKEYKMRQRMQVWDQFASSIAFFPSGQSVIVYRMHQWQSDQMAGTTQSRLLPDATRKDVPTPLERTASSDFYGHLHFSADGHFLFRNAERQQDSTVKVEVYRVLAGDKLVRVPQNFVPDRLGQIAVDHPSGSFVYGRSRGSLDTYSVSRGGKLTYIDSAPFSRGVHWVNEVFIESSGRFLYGVEYVPTGPRGAGPPETAPCDVYAIDAAGKLTAVRQILLPPQSCRYATVALP